MAIRAEMVKHHRYLHVLISYVPVVVSQKHHLVLLSKPIVRYGDISRSKGNVDESVLTLVQSVVVQPYVRGCDQSDSIAID